MNASQSTVNLIELDNKTVLLPLSLYVKQTVEHYLSQLSGHDAVGLHAMVILSLIHI
jgi:Fis family transcriptional regulator